MRFLVWPLLTAFVVTASEQSKTMAPWEDDFRIPADTYAKHYDLYLHPNMATDRFSGRVTITISTSQPRDSLLCHVKYLNVTKTEVKDDNGVSVAVSNAFEYQPNEFWVVQLGQSITPGNYSLYLEFEGRLDNGIVGFYKSVYQNENGEQRALATSKFQPTYARRAFPCFDEPSFKSSFKITLVRPTGDNYIALSNMLEESSEADSPAPGLTTVAFQTSVPMVSYLAVFIVCDFVYLETTTPTYNIPFRVYGTTVIRDRLQYAMDVGVVVSDFYTSFFNVPYPLPKLHMAAIPDYSSGATEHWGLITYRETGLAFDPNESSTRDQEYVASVIAHELAHQWFGNLVTLEWWNDLWLNEGFATYLSYKGVKSYETDWDTDSMFLGDTLHGVLDLDATLSSRKIVYDVSTPDQINAVFDTISYSKGSSVIRMMDNFLGEDDFKAGITSFLIKYSFKNAITQDLFDELAAASSENLDVTKIMNTWTRQKGYPVLNVARNGNTYTLTQERFLTDPEAYNQTDETSPYNYKWEIPVTYITSDNPGRTQIWFHLEDDAIPVFIPSSSAWTKFNVGQYGYYRVNYPIEEWNAFSQLLIDDINALSTSDRVSLINDAFSLAAGDRLSYDVALGITKYLSNERQYVPWQSATSAIGYFDDVLYYTEVNVNLQQYQRQLSQDVYNEVGWVDEGDYNMKMLRTRILSFACSSGLTECLDTVGDKFDEWRSSGTAVPPNFKTIVYNFGMKVKGNQEVWDWMYHKYLNESNAQEKLKLMSGLAQVQDASILYNFIQLAKDVNVVREQNFFTCLKYISSNRIGEPIVWDFVRDEWEYLVDRFTLNDRYLGSLIPSITRRFATQRRLDEMNEFFERYPEAGAGEQNRQIALETVENNIKFVQKYSDVINDWLISNTKA